MIAKARLLLVSAVLASLFALGCASPTPTPIPTPTPTPIPPVHTLVTCREVADRMTLANDSIRKITRLQPRFKGQDRFECLGWADVEWAADGWVVLTARRDYSGAVNFSLNWD